MLRCVAYDKYEWTDMVPLPTYVYFLCVVVVFKESDFHVRQLATGQTDSCLRTAGRNDGRRTHTRAKGTGTRIPEAKVADPPGLPRPPTAGQKGERASLCSVSHTLYASLILVCMSKILELIHKNGG